MLHEMHTTLYACTKLHNSVSHAKRNIGSTHQLYINMHAHSVHARNIFPLAKKKKICTIYFSKNHAHSH